MAIDPSVLDLPLPQADEHTTAVAQAQCRELLARRHARAGVAGRVRDQLMARAADPPDLGQVAAALNVSDRTLRRRLAGEGVSFRGLLDEIREQLAEELLVTGGFSVAEVAERLGYLEVSSFSQAFRRWKGVGPRAWRAGHPNACSPDRASPPETKRAPGGTAALETCTDGSRNTRPVRNELN